MQEEMIDKIKKCLIAGYDVDIITQEEMGILWNYITNLQEKLEVSQTNEETYRLEMQDITKCLDLKEDTIFDEVKEYATNLQEENEYSNHCNEELRKKITNLEYKIERQKEELNEQYKQRDKFKKKYSYLKVAKEDYKSRNEKAIEDIDLLIHGRYIENNTSYMTSPCCNLRLEIIKNDLQGDDKE